MYELSEKTTFFESIYKDYQDILLIKQHKIEIENFGEEHLKLATTLVSAKCDIASTHFYSPPEKYSKLRGAWISYFQKRYPSLEITSSLLDKVMDKCRAAAADYWLKN